MSAFTRCPPDPSVADVLYLAEFYFPGGEAALADLARRAHAAAAPLLTAPPLLTALPLPAAPLTSPAPPPSPTVISPGAPDIAPGPGSAGFVLAIHVPADEICFALYDAQGADAVLSAGARAGITFERVTAAILPGRAGAVRTMADMTEAAPGAFPVTTALELTGMTVERDLGVAFGLVVRSMGFTKSLGAGFKALRQGEVTQYTALLEDSRRHAVDRMIDNARLLGGNAVVAMRFDSSEMGQQLTEIVAYGTAVVARPAG
jgi:uncharacterized protein YbjQ (UPF0145 family)